MSNTRPKLLVTGATGAIGDAMVQAFLRNAYEVTILTKQSPKWVRKECTYIIADLTNKEQLSAALGPLTIDVVVHAGGMTRTHSPKEYIGVNVEGTRNFIQILKGKHVSKFVFISSRARHDDCGAYGHSKRLAEDVVKKSALPWVILQPAEIYGGNASEAIRTLLSMARIYRTALIPGSGAYELAPLFIDDFADAVSRTLLTGKLQSEYVLAGPQSMSFNDIVRIIENHEGHTLLKIHVPLPFLRIVAYVAQCMGSHSIVSDQIDRLRCNKSSDISHAKADLAFNPATFEEGLKKLKHTRT